MKTCEYFEELIGAAADGEITAAEEAELREHLESCEHCRSFFEALRSVSDTDSVLPDTPVDFTAAVMSRVREAAAPGKAKKKPSVIRLITRYGAIAAAAALAIWAGVSFGDKAAPQSTDSAAPASVYYEEAEAETGSTLEEAASEEEAVAETTDEEPMLAVGFGASAQSDETAGNGARAVNGGVQVRITKTAENGSETELTDDGFFADYLLTGEEAAVLEGEADYTLTLTEPDGTESRYLLWTDRSEIFWQTDGEEDVHLSPASPEELDTYLLN